MSESPFGDPTVETNGTDAVINGATASSIVDTILNLDELLSSDVRLAEKSARFSIKPQLEAEMEDLTAELDGLTDSQGRPQTPVDASVADGVRSARSVALEIEKTQAEYAASMRTVRLRQMDEDDWTAFLQRHKETLAGEPPYTAGFYEELICASAIAPTFTVEQLREFRKKVGHPAFNEVFQKAWAVNSQSGVSVPKSWLSSVVLRHIEQG